MRTLINSQINFIQFPTHNFYYYYYYYVALHVSLIIIQREGHFTLSSN
jgi:hypothetical protein